MIAPSQIRRLDAATVEQIAAGEVVERPLSVVKELVENAIDAGARRIEVVVDGGGTERIVVADDGAGIRAGDMPLALARHATSKLATATDLAAVATLGFRGEGLAAIAAVARVRIVSRPFESDIAGAAIASAFGEAGPVEPAACPPGTRVDVRDLFANVPVRRDFLRSPGVEFARIASFLATFSLAYPDVAFVLARDGRQTFSFAAGGGYEARLAYVFAQGARDLVALEPRTWAGGTVTGFASRPGIDRPDRRGQHVFVNRRLLRSTQLAGAWSAGYATYAMSQRQPFGVLLLDVAPEDVDPNVHPTKSDVRFRRGAALADAVKAALRATLEREAAARLARSFSLAPPAPPRECGVQPAAPPLPAFADGEAFAPARAETMRILAQLDETYILATDGDALVLIDQHAAHERVAFETIARRSAAHAAGEPLLVPYLVELDAADAARFEAARERLARAGLEAEPFGEGVYRVVATPAGYGARRFSVRGYLDDLSDDVPGLSADERVWASLACHSVVRAGDRMEHAEMAALLAQLQSCANPMHCPHGRPTTVRIEPADLARLFKRA